VTRLTWAQSPHRDRQQDWPLTGLSRTPRPPGPVPWRTSHRGRLAGWAGAASRGQVPRL